MLDEALYTPAFLADPYPVYDRMRAEAPILWSERFGRWYLTRHTDATFVLRDPRFSAARAGTAMQLRSPELLQEIAPLARLRPLAMVLSDPPDHTRVRGLVSKAFTPRTVEQMRPHVERLVDDLLARVEPVGAMDVVRDLAAPLAAIVICELLGISPDERERVRRWADSLSTFSGNLIGGPEVDRNALATVREAAEYFAYALHQVRACPRDDLLSAMVAAEERGEILTGDELLANVLLLIAAGQETTTNLIGNGVLTLLRHRDQWERLRREPELIGTAIEELLRYESPVQAATRLAAEDVEVGGTRIARGDSVVSLLGSANRDPEQFEQPQRVDIGRRENRHLAFSHGAHFCFGAGLGRVQGQIAIGAVVKRFPRLELATTTVEWGTNGAFRGLVSLPVKW
ncbi:MAG: cytochrome P450 [Chloroflexi bacterium]|nr:cytochrome P450 [Chloroflexota bacterium]